MFIFVDFLDIVHIKTFHKKLADLARFSIKRLQIFNTFQKHLIEPIFQIFIKYFQLKDFFFNFKSLYLVSTKHLQAFKNRN